MTGPRSTWIHPELKCTAPRYRGLDLSFVAIPFPVSLVHCRLSEEATFWDAQLPLLDLEGSWTQAIRADRLTVKGSVFLRNGFHAQGEVRLVGAQIGSALDCAGGTFNNPDHDALIAARVNVKGSVVLNTGFHAEGEVRLLGAQIGDELDCDGGTFTNPNGHALMADRLEVRGSIFVRDGFHAEGEVQLMSAQIGSDLDCSGGAFSSVNIERTSIKGNFFWQKIFSPEKMRLDLENASAGGLSDDGPSLHIRRGQLFLDGFVYGRIATGPTDAETRLKWLALQPLFEPQPYRQLAKVLEERGDDDGATRVLEEMERLRRKQEDRTRRAQVESWILKESIGYGYTPGLAVWELAGLGVLGWIIYRRSYLAGSMVPTDKDAYQAFKSREPSGRPPAHYERFAPLTYSVENSLPLVKFGQGDRWHPDPEPPNERAQTRRVVYRLGSKSARSRWLGRLRRWPAWLGWLRRFLVWAGLKPDTRLHPPPGWRFARFGTSPRFLRWFLWLQILLGWLLATLFLAGLTGIVRKA